MTPPSVKSSSTATALPQPTGQQLREQLVKYVDETIRITGPGPWEWDPDLYGRIPPKWNADTATFAGEPCDISLSGDESEQFTVHLYGPPVADPNAKAQEVLAAWKALGYRTRLVGTPSPPPVFYNEIAAETPDGAQLGFTASTLISSFGVQSACTTDPLVLDGYIYGPGGSSRRYEVGDAPAGP